MEVPPKKVGAAGALRLFLSLAIAFHLLCMVSVPNRAPAAQSENSGSVVDAYSGTLGLWSTWNFFAPDPGPAVAIEYELFDSKGDSIRKGLWPDFKKHLFFHDRLLRRLSSTQYMIFVHPEAAGRMLASYFCSTDSRINSIRATAVIYPTPSLAELNGKNPTNAGIERQTRNSIGLEFCGDATASTI